MKNKEKGKKERRDQEERKMTMKNGRNKWWEETMREGEEKS